VVIIPNTLHLTECLISEAVAKKLPSKPGMELSDISEEFSFGPEGNLLLQV
jgi:hypothetical protein